MNNEIKVMTVSLDFPLSSLTLLIILNHQKNLKSSRS